MEIETEKGKSSGIYGLVLGILEPSLNQEH
jgi:hypothetical protein